MLRQDRECRYLQALFRGTGTYLGLGTELACTASLEVDESDRRARESHSAPETGNPNPPKVRYATSIYLHVLYYYYLALESG